MIGLYALVLRQQAPALGVRGEPVRALACDGFVALVGEAPPPLTPEALRAHEATVRRIADAHEACLPARFGAVAEDDEALCAALAPRAGELREALALVRNREQMTLRLSGEARPVAAPPAAGPGTHYLEERRRARRLPELDPLRALLRDLVHEERLVRHGEPGLVASVYHLIDRGRAADYERRVAGAALDWRVRVSGPWPAWSFAPEVLTP